MVSVVLSSCSRQVARYRPLEEIVYNDLDVKLLFFVHRHKYTFLRASLKKTTL